MDELDLERAIDYIENNIQDELDYEQISRQAYMSSYYFQRLFAFLFHCTLGEYIRNRRLSLAGEDLLSSDEKIIDIAMKYRYDTPEGFTRAFFRFYGITPSAARSRKTKLTPFAKVCVQSILKGDKSGMNELSKRGYVVKGNSPVYFTKNMDQTSKWFEDILGWYADIAARNDEGIGTYGCATPIPGELINMQIADFNGIHMFNGEPQQRMAAFIMVQGIENLYTFVTQNGWEQISEIKVQPWGAKVCNVTTIDGAVLTFFELLS